MTGGKFFFGKNLGLALAAIFAPEEREQCLTLSLKLLSARFVYIVLIDLLIAGSVLTQRDFFFR